MAVRRLEPVRDDNWPVGSSNKILAARYILQIETVVRGRYPTAINTCRSGGFNTPWEELPKKSPRLGNTGVRSRRQIVRRSFPEFADGLARRTVVGH